MSARINDCKGDITLKTSTKIWLVAGVVIAAIATTKVAHAASVKATAEAVIDSQTGPTAVLATATATAIDRSLFATTTRVAATVTGAVDIFVLSGAGASTIATTEFTVVGLGSATPLTFNWSFSGNYSLTANNSTIQSSLQFYLDSPGFLSTVSWGNSYVAAFGSTAGNLSSPFGVAAAGGNFVNSLPLGDWDGLGTVYGSTTILSATAATTGAFAIASGIGISGITSANYTVRLDSVTAPYDVTGAYLLLDSGSQIPIDSATVPEPTALVLFSSALVGLLAHRRRRN